MRKLICGVVGAVMLAASALPALATDPTITIPDSMQPATVANSALTVIGPLVGFLITISLTLTAGIVLVKVIRRKASAIH